MLGPFRTKLLAAHIVTILLAGLISFLLPYILQIPESEPDRTIFYGIPDLFLLVIGMPFGYLVLHYSSPWTDVTPWLMLAATPWVAVHALLTARPPRSRD